MAFADRERSTAPALQVRSGSAHTALRSSLTKVLAVMGASMAWGPYACVVPWAQTGSLACSRPKIDFFRGLPTRRFAQRGLSGGLSFMTARQSESATLKATAPAAEPSA